MMLGDFHNKFDVKYGTCLTQSNSDTAIASAIIDRANYEMAEFICLAGTMTDTDATFAVTMEHGDDSGLSDTAAVTAADLIGDLPSWTKTEDGTAYKVGYKGAKRYLRLTITPTGNNSGAAPVAIACLLVNPRKIS